MPLYYFQLRTADAAPHPAQARMLPNLAAALVEAQHAARGMIRTRVRRVLGAPSGSLDIEDEARQPVARILLADVAHQIS
ncbi:MAG: hypothetical protein EOP60_07750 [Sphingomonadales bacterium]|nr:MAG: hypothetical protein EOP60_07750 [Sphingomonadales bacterium]